MQYHNDYRKQIIGTNLHKQSPASVCTFVYWWASKSYQTWRSFKKFSNFSPLYRWYHAGSSTWAKSNLNRARRWRLLLHTFPSTSTFPTPPSLYSRADRTRRTWTLRRAAIATSRKYLPSWRWDVLKEFAGFITAEQNSVRYRGYLRTVILFLEHTSQLVFTVPCKSIHTFSHFVVIQPQTSVGFWEVNAKRHIFVKWYNNYI